METKIVNIWLDDQRTAPDGWLHLHNIEEVEKLVEMTNGIKDFYIDSMSFDFHLSHPKNGLDVLEFLVEVCKKYNTNKFWPKNILYHSNDINGIKLMKEFVEDFEKNIKAE